MRSQNHINNRSITTNQQKMSNSLQNLVPVLDGANYRRWADLMKAYLQSQGVWILIELPDGFTEPTQASDGSNHSEVLE